MWRFLIFLSLFFVTIDGWIRGKHLREPEESGEWEGVWFPNPPKTAEEIAFDKAYNHCDDGVHSIDMDFDPYDKRHSYNYLCLSKKTKYEPNMSTEALSVEHVLPPAFRPRSKCMNETITYNEQLPTYGTFRPILPKYGNYLYLPPQRWLHNLAAGGIAMLYHPCAERSQVSALQKLVEGCLYRHVISPYMGLSAERPLAVVAWGKCLQMSVIDNKLVVEFIKNNARRGPLANQQNEIEQFYDAGMISEAHLVTDSVDTDICGSVEEIM